MVGRAAPSMDWISPGQAVPVGGFRRAVSGGHASGRRLLCVVAFILCLMAAGVLQANDHRGLTDRRRLIAARLALAQIGHPLALVSKPASGKATVSTARSCSRSTVSLLLPGGKP